jgi:aspartate racemase
MKKAVGIIGGMGPMATVELFHNIVKFTDAGKDSEHIHIYIDNNVNIPDRTASILFGGPSPVPYIVDSAKKLEQMGAELLAFPCNTLHYYWNEITQKVNVPIINMLEETAIFAREAGYEKVGLLATSATVHSGIYEKYLNRFGIYLILPDDEGQDEIMRLIYDGVKAGAETYNTCEFMKVIDRMCEKGASSFILGCTELPIAVYRYGLSMSYIDPSVILAKTLIRIAGYSLRNEKLLGR